MVYTIIAIAPRSEVIAPDRLLTMGQIELFDILNEYKQMTC